jgi:hypothetical protein
MKGAEESSKREKKNSDIDSTVLSRVSEVVARRGGLDHVAICRILKSTGTCGRWIDEIA